VEPGFRGSVTGTLIEASAARLLTQVNVPNPDELLAELGIEESDLDEYDYAIVANSVTPGLTPALTRRRPQGPPEGGAASGCRTGEPVILTAGVAQVS
jgi:hypothetical protein